MKDDRINNQTNVINEIHKKVEVLEYEQSTFYTDTNQQISQQNDQNNKSFDKVVTMESSYLKLKSKLKKIDAEILKKDNKIKSVESSITSKVTELFDIIRTLDYKINESMVKRGQLLNPSHRRQSHKHSRSSSKNRKSSDSSMRSKKSKHTRRNSLRPDSNSYKIIASGLKDSNSSLAPPFYKTVQK